MASSFAHQVGPDPGSPLSLPARYLLQDAATKGKAAVKEGQGPSGFQSFVETILGNLQLSITNVHIRYEVSMPPHQFICRFHIAPRTIALCLI